MKSLIIFIFATTILIGCKKKGCTDPVAINYNQHAEQDDGSCNYQHSNSLPSIIDTDLILTNDSIWTIAGRVTVTNGATLTIEPGTIIKAESGTGANASCLLISRNSKINAQGTYSQPIIFTSIADDIELGQIKGSSLSSSVNGLWGGIIICGNAPISADAASVQIEGIPASDQNGLYGGADSTDNSGILRYVSIRHGGANIGEGNEINGLTLGGVGSGTTIENIEIVANQDDAIEFFGGSVNVSNILVWNFGDDGIDIDQSYTGTVNRCLIIPGITSDHALEIDGGEGSWTHPFLINECQVISEAAEAHFRAGAKGQLFLKGNVNIEHDPGTSVIVENLLSDINMSLFSWTYWFNN